MQPDVLLSALLREHDHSTYALDRGRGLSLKVHPYHLRDDADNPPGGEPCRRDIRYRYLRQPACTREPRAIDVRGYFPHLDFRGEVSTGPVCRNRQNPI